MTKNEQCHQRLTNVFRKVFDDPSLQIEDDFNADNIPGWDSLEHINLVLEIEGEFGISLSTAEIAGFNRVRDVKKIILQRAAL